MTAAPASTPRRIVATALRVDRSKLAFRQGVRLAAGVGICLLAGVATDHIAEGVAGSLGALAAGFADLGGAYLGRLRTMLLASVSVALGAFLGSISGSSDVASVLLMGVVGFCGAITMAVSVPASFIGLQGSLGMILTLDASATLGESLQRAALVLAGGALQSLLAVGVWPLRPTRPERTAIGAVYRALAGRAREPLHPDVTEALGAADTVLSESVGRAGAHTPLGEGLRGLLVEAERISAEFAAIEAERRPLAEAGDPAAAQAEAVVAAAADALRRDAAALEARQAPDVHDAIRARIDAAAAAIEADAAAAAEPGRTRRRELAARVRGLCGQLGGVADLVAACSRPAADGTASGRWPVPRADRALFAPLAIVRANLTLSSPACRHAVRLGTTLAVGVAIDRIVGLPRGYWVPLTVLFVLRPDFGSTFMRGVARYGGTAIGAVAATALTALLAPGDYVLVALATVFAAGVYTFFYANYALFTASITACIVFVVAFSGVDEYTAILDRALDTAIGAALALLAYVVWPTWEAGQVPVTVADLLEADRRYATAVLGAIVDPAAARPGSIGKARRSARRARTTAEASIERWLSEPARQRRDADAALGLLAASRRYAAAALALESRLAEGDRHPAPEAAGFAAVADGALEAIVGAERSGRPGGDLPPLRSAQTELATARGQRDFLVEQTDRMVDALDTMGHLVGMGKLVGAGRPPAASPAPRPG